MLEKFFVRYPDVNVIRKPSIEEVACYRQKLPDYILSLWEQYGLGVYMDGYLRLVDPAEYQFFSDNYVENIGYECTPFGVSCYGDLFVWVAKGDGYIDFYDYRHSESKLLENFKNLDLFFNRIITDDDFIWDELNCVNFQETKSKLGIPDYDQCYGYFPLLALGGKESINNLKIVDLKTHMDILAQVTGPL